MAERLRIGTRGSALALAQADLVASSIGRELPSLALEVLPIAVSGDGALGPEALRAGAGEPYGAGPEDKRRWVDAIERALLGGEIDLAVHSAKDLPSELPDGLELLGAPPRGARVGTASLRRAAQLRAFRPDLSLQPLRGNVDTRLRKLALDGDLDAIVLAHAGLERLGLEDSLGGLLELERFVPAPGQGTLALEGRARDARARDAAASIVDADSFACLRAERALAKALRADCHTPLGAHAAPAGCGCLQMRAWVGLPDGSEWARDELLGGFYEPERLGERIAERLSATGALELLSRAREMAPVAGA
jgi:hydroxymethylbilane synthase